MAAVRTLATVRREVRPATLDEQAVMARWSGWGATPQLFDTDRFADQRARLREMLTEEEYAAARRSTINAHYTDAALVSVIWDAALALGFTGGTVLEPGCGSGHFIGLAPASADLVGVEREPISAGIAAALYPDAEIITGSFTDLVTPEGSFDLVIGNVPFGDVVIRSDSRHNPNEHRIHNHFILKSLHLTRPGGLVMVLTSHHTMDALNPAARTEMAQLADLVGAVRLPTNAHRKAAGTNIVTDLLVLRRREPDTTPRVPFADTWERAMPTAIGEHELPINQYFADRPHLVLGRLAPGRSRLGRPALAVIGDPGAAPAQLATALEQITSQARDRGLTWAPPAATPTTPRPVAAVGVVDQDAAAFRGFVTAHPDGSFTRRVGDTDQPFVPPASQADELRRLLGLRDTVMALLAAEQASLDDTPEIESLRARLNTDYDAYVAEYGPVCRFTERRQIRQVWHVFSEWCDQNDRVKAPAEPETVRDYLTDLRHRGLGQDQLRRHLDGIAAAHTTALARQVRKAVTTLTKSLEQRYRGDELDRALTVLRRRVDSDPRRVVLAAAQTPIEFPAAAAAAGDAVIATAAERTDPDLDLDAIGLRTTVIVRPPQGGFRGTPFSQRVRALEKFDPTTGTARKATVFRQRVINPPRTRLGADTPEEALSICLDTESRVDLAVIARLLGLPDEQRARAALGELVYDDPATGAPIWARQYLSGNVRAKLAAAREAADPDPAFAVNVAALERVVPADLGPEDIEIRLGSWIGPEYVQQFLRDLLGDPRVQVERAAGLWAVSGNDRTIAATQLWGAGGLDVFDLTHRLLTGAEIKVTRTITVDGTEQSVLDPEATEAARDKAVEIGDRFADWVWDDTTRATGLMRAYNDTFNAVVAPDFTGVELSLPGLSFAYDLKEHQLAAVARIIYQPATGLVHETGAGKTLEMIVGVMERRRRGLSTRPVVVVPNDSIAEQFEQEWSQAYPGARLLTATSAELTGPGGADLRRELVARIAQDDYDAVIMTKESFQRIPLQPEAMEAFLRRELDDLIAAKEAGRASSKTLTKQLETAIENTQEKLEKRLREIDRDVAGITFGDTGIDLVVIDEAQNYKNGMVHSSLPGLALEGADRAVDLDAKLAWLAQRHGESRVVLATATPWTNSLPEVYLWMRRLGHDLPPHDEWARTFATSETYMEMTAGGRLQPRTRFRRMINEPELWHMVRQTSDVKMRADLAHLVKVPPLRGGAVEILTADAPAEARVFTLDLARRERNLGGKPEVGKDNALVVQHDGLLVALDVRTVGLRTSDPQKVDVLAEDIHHEWSAARDTVYLRDDGTEHPVRGGLILVFCDESTPGKAWNFYDQLKHHLVQLGLPERSVRFIHEGSSPQRKADLLAACREGAVSVLIGSSMKMGAGLNVQTRVLGGYEVTAPWRPDVSVQAMGRAGRQGNQNDTWFWKRIVTAPSMDAKRWEVCKQKADMFAPLYASQVPTRTRDLGEDHAPGLADVMAAATGDPRYLEKAELDQEHKSLTRRRAAHLRNQQALRLSVAENTTSIAKLTERAARQEATAQRWISTRGDAFRMEIDGRTYDKRVEAAEALKAFLVDQTGRLRIAERRTVPVGSLGGYAVAASVAGRDSDSAPIFVVFPDAPESTTSVVVRLDEFPARHGIITRLENELDAIPGAAAATREEIERAERNLDQARSGLDAPFPHEERLATVTQRRAQLLAELSATTDQHGDSDADPDSPEGKARAEQAARLADLHTAARDHALTCGTSTAGADRFASWYLAITTGVMPEHLPELDVSYSVWRDLGAPVFDSGKRHSTPIQAMDRPRPASPPAPDPAQVIDSVAATGAPLPVTVGPSPAMDSPSAAADVPETPPTLRVSLRALREAAAAAGLSVLVERVGTESFLVVHEPAVPDVGILGTDAAGVLVDPFGQRVQLDQVADWLRGYRARTDPTAFDTATSVPDWARRTARLAPYGLAGPHHNRAIDEALTQVRSLVNAGGHDEEVERLLRSAEAAATADHPIPARRAALVRCMEQHAAGYHRASGNAARYIVEHLHGTAAELDWVTGYLAEHPHLLTTPSSTEQQRRDHDAADRAAGEQQAHDAARRAQHAYEAGEHDLALDLLDEAELAAPHHESRFEHLRGLVRTAATTVPVATAHQPPPVRSKPPTRPSGHTTASEDTAATTNSRADDRNRLLQVTGAAAAWFEAQFDADNRRAGQVREYLERRIGGLDKVEWARQQGFQIGYAPGQGWTELVDHLRTQGYTDEELLAAGVATRSGRGTLVDRFQKRLMFGIHDTNGDLAGFIGRTVSAGVEPKYLNSPAGVLFDKKRLLFGWWEQRDHTGDTDPMFVEGPIDVLAVAAADGGRWHLPIAPCGTALTTAHLDIVDAVVPTDRRRILAFDGDDPGRKAAVAHAETAHQRYPNLVITTLPDGMDPAEWATTDATDLDSAEHGGRMAVYRTTPYTRPALDVLIDERVDRWSDRLEWAEGRLGAARDVARLLAALGVERTPEVISRAIEVATRLKVDPAAMPEFIAAARHNHATLPGPPAPDPQRAATAQPAAPTTEDRPSPRTELPPRPADEPPQAASSAPAIGPTVTPDAGLESDHDSVPVAVAPLAAPTTPAEPSVTAAEQGEQHDDVPTVVEEPLSGGDQDVGLPAGEDAADDVDEPIDIDAADDPLGDVRPGVDLDHGDIAATLQGLIGSQFATVVRGLVVDARRPDLDAGYWSRIRPAFLPDPGVIENVRHDGKGVRIDISATEERRVGRLSWGQVFDWLRPGLTAARVQVLLAADTAHTRSLAAEATLQAAGTEVAETVTARLDRWRGLAQSAIVQAAWATHEGHGRASRRQRKRPDLRALTTDTDTLTTADRAALTRIADLAAALPDTVEAPQPDAAAALGGAIGGPAATWTGAEANDPRPALLTVPEGLDLTDYGWTSIDVAFHHSGAVERWHRDDTELLLRWTNTEADLLLNTRLRVAHSEHTITSLDDLTTVLTEAGRHGVAYRLTNRWTVVPTPTAAAATAAQSHAGHGARLVHLAPSRGWEFTDTDEPVITSDDPGPRGQSTAPATPGISSPAALRKDRVPSGQLSLWDIDEPDTEPARPEPVPPAPAPTDSGAQQSGALVPARAVLDHAVVVAQRARARAEAAGGHSPEAWLAFSELVRSDPGTGIAYSAVEPEFAAVGTWWAQQAIDALTDAGYQVDVKPADGRRTRRAQPIVVDHDTRTITVDAGLTSGLVAHYLVTCLADLRSAHSVQDEPTPPPVTAPVLPYDRRHTTTGIDERVQLTSPYLLAGVADQLATQPRPAAPTAVTEAMLAALPDEVRATVTHLARQADRLDAIANAAEAGAKASTTITGLGQQGVVADRTYRGFGVLADCPGLLTIACGDLRFRGHTDGTDTVITIHIGEAGSDDDIADHVAVDPAWHQPEHTHRIQDAVLGHLSTARTRAHEHREQIAALITDHTPATTPAAAVVIRHAPGGTVVDLRDLPGRQQEAVAGVLTRHSFTATAHPHLWAWPPVWFGARTARLDRVMQELAAANVAVDVLDDLPDELIPPPAEAAIPVGDPFNTAAEHVADEQAVHDAIHAVNRLPAARRLLGSDRPDAAAVSGALATVLAHPPGTAPDGRRGDYERMFRALDTLSAGLRLEEVKAPVMRRRLLDLHTAAGRLLGRIDATPDLAALSPTGSAPKENLASAGPDEPPVHLQATQVDFALGLRRMYGHRLADLVGPMVASQPFQKPTLSAALTNRRAHEPDAGASERVTTTGRGIEIEVRTPIETRTGRWTWKQVTRWLHAGLDAADVRVLLDASRAAFRFHLNAPGFLALGEHDLADQAHRELTAMAGAAAGRILDRARDAHEAAPARPRSTSRLTTAPQPAADADVPPEHAAQTARIAALSAVLPERTETRIPLSELSTGDVLVSVHLSGPVRVHDIVDHGDTVSLSGTVLNRWRGDIPCTITVSKNNASGAVTTTLERVNLPASLATLVAAGQQPTASAQTSPSAAANPAAAGSGGSEPADPGPAQADEVESRRGATHEPSMAPAEPIAGAIGEPQASTTRQEPATQPVVDDVTQHWVALVASAAARGYRVQAAYTAESSIDHRDAVIHIAAGQPPLSRVVDLALKVGEIAVTAANITTTPALTIDPPLSTDPEQAGPVEGPTVDAAPVTESLEPPAPTMTAVAVEQRAEPVPVADRWDSQTPIFDQLRHAYPSTVPAEVPTPREPFPAPAILEPRAAVHSETPIFHQLRRQFGLHPISPAAPLTAEPPDDNHLWTDDLTLAAGPRTVLPGSPARTTFTTAPPPGSWGTSRGRST